MALEVETQFERGALEDYLHCFSNQNETGLLFLEAEEAPAGFLWDRCAELLNGFGLRPAGSWRALLGNFSCGESSFIRLRAPLAKELYDIIAQLHRRRSLLQIIDPDTLELNTVHFDPDRQRLLLIAGAADLREIEKRFAILDKVGLIGRSLWS